MCTPKISYEAERATKVHQEVGRMPFPVLQREQKLLSRPAGGRPVREKAKKCRWVAVHEKDKAEMEIEAEADSKEN